MSRRASRFICVAAGTLAIGFSCAGCDNGESGAGVGAGGHAGNSLGGGGGTAGSKAGNDGLGGGGLSGGGLGGSLGNAGASGDTGGAGGGGGGGGERSCPPTPQPSGTPCSGVKECTYLDCSGAGQVTVRCNGAMTSVETLACAATRCGGLSGPECAAGQLCVTYSGSGMPAAKCIQDTCRTGAIDCDCAGAVCGGSTCSIAGTTVACSGLCPDC